MGTFLLLLAYLNTGTAAAPVWSVLGKRVTDSSESLDWSQNSDQDITGQTHTSMKKPVITQTFDPVPLEGGNTAMQYLWNRAVRDQDAQAMASLDMLIVHRYAGVADAPFAERYHSCAIAVTGLGGEGGGDISMPFEVTYGGVRDTGTASISNAGVVTFTKDAQED